MASPDLPEGNVGRFFRALEVGTNVVAPIALLSALAVWFGSVRTGALYGFFGVETSVLAFSIQDFAVRSIGLAFRPILIVLIATAVLVGAARLLTALDSRLSIRGWRINFSRITVSYIGLVELALAVLTIYSPWAAIAGVDDPIRAFRILNLSQPLTAAISLSIGSLLLIHAVPLLVSRTDVYVRRRPDRLTVTNVLCGIAFVVGLFWSASVLAQRSGEDVANFINSRPEAQAYVAVFSPTSISALSDGGVTSSQSADGVFKYSGLRLLSYTNTRWFLFTGRRSSNGRLEVAIVPDGDTMQVVVGRS